MGPTEILSRFVIDTKLEQIPEEVIHEAKRCFINYLGVSLGALEEDGAKILLEWIRAEGGVPNASIIGTGERTTAVLAALANGYLAHLLDYDDTHLPTILHPSAPIWPAVQSVAEEQGLSGREALIAFAIGVEVASRLSLSVHPWHYDGGWHITGTAGIFGATAAAGRLLGLSVPQMAHAFGIAGTQSSGVREVMGTMSKALHAGKAASNGIQSATLALAGFTSAETILEGRRGFWAVLSPNGHDEAALTVNLKERWEIFNNGLKPYANGVVAHPLQDAAINLRDIEGISPDKIAGIHAQVHPLVMELMDRPNPQHGFDGKFSFQYCVAAGLVDGGGFPKQFSDERFKDPVIASLLRKVTGTANKTVNEDEAYLTVTLTDGRTVEHHVQHATGSPSNPMTDETLENKFRALARLALPNEQVEALLKSSWELDQLPKLGDLTGLLSFPKLP